MIFSLCRNGMNFIALFTSFYRAKIAGDYPNTLLKAFVKTRVFYWSIILRNVYFHDNKTIRVNVFGQAFLMSHAFERALCKYNHCVWFYGRSLQ